jgi:integrase
MASIRKRNGKFQVQIRRTGYPTISKSFAQKKDAQEWARLREIELDRDELAPCRRNLSTIKLRDLVLRYMSEVLPEKRSQEVETIVLNRFLKDPICRRPLSNLATSDFAEYRDRRLTEIAPISLKRQLAPLHNMFELAQDEWGIPIKENPLAKLKLKATDNRRERRLKEGELERLLEAGKYLRNPYVVTVLLFALETAMRRGEILSLCWDQIDTKRSSATILESKNGYSRTIPLSPKAIALLHDCRGEGDGCFPITANAIRLAWGRLCKKAQVHDLHFHDLRHEAISRFFEIGLTVPEVASISGHRDFRILSRYAHSRPELILRKLCQ